MQKTVAKFSTFEEADKADREFYRKLTPQERLDLLLELLSHAPEQRLERVYRVVKISDLSSQAKSKICAELER